MTRQMTRWRGADVLTRVLDRAGQRTIFALSGNHIMPVFDATIGTGLALIHTRHEAASVHMADAYAPVVAVMGDGTFGFHMAEFDTAVRHNLPFVAVVANDASWGAEHQIQLRDYGADRTHSCALLPSRYDQVAVALGGHGELVTEAAALAPALERAIDSGKPACLNVMIAAHRAPVVRQPV